MRKTYGKYGVLGVLVLALLLALLLVAGAASAGSAKGAPSFTWDAVFDWGEETPTVIDWGVTFPDHPDVGNTTILHWRIRPQLIVSFPNKPGVRQWWDLYDWNMVLLDKPGPNYPADPNDVIPGWHYHWGTGIVSSVMPSAVSPYEPPKKSWLWTTKFTGITTPAGVHYITEDWTGCNRYKGLKAYCTWTMAQPDYSDAAGKVWILH